MSGSGLQPIEVDCIDDLGIFGNGIIRDLDFNPKEWRWKKIGAQKAGNFFSYETKKGSSSPNIANSTSISG
jgi:hypothetical protein